MINKSLKKIGLISLSTIGLLTLGYKGYKNFPSKYSIYSGGTSTNSIVQSSTKPIDEKEKSNTNDSYDIEKLKNDLNNKEKDGKKIAFLTFDDGPSTTVTPEILDVLKEKNVKATFFLMGQNVDRNDKSKSLVKEIFESGHAIGNHTYNHDMKKLYPNNKLDINAYMDEVNQCNDSIRKAIGQDFRTRVLRMPGGYMSREYYKDPNLQAFDTKIAENDMWQIDWNAMNADAEGKKKDAAELLENLKESVGTKEKVVILMHDTYGKEETAKALPQIIEYLKSQGYEFKTMS